MAKEIKDQLFDILVKTNFRAIESELEKDLRMLTESAE